MPKLSEPLTDKTIQRLKSGSKYDGGCKGLQIQVMPDARKRWSYHFTDGVKRNTRRLGYYPEMTLEAAREQGVLIQAAILQGVNVDLILGRSDAVTHAAATQVIEEEGLTLKAVVSAYLIHFTPQWSTANKTLIEHRIEKDVLPTFGARPIKSIEGLELLEHLKTVHRRAPETSKRVYSILVQIWRFAILYKYADSSPLLGFKAGDVGKVVTNHLDAIIEPSEFGAMLRQIKEHPSVVTRAALLTSAHCFIRSFALRHATWDEVDFERRQWVVPMAHMKVKTQNHLIPLSTQMLQIFRELKTYTGDSGLIFPSFEKRPLSDGTLSMALKRIGVKHTQHGFRASFRTLADEQLRQPIDLIEHQLAHVVKDPLGRAYNRTTKIEDRRVMMQLWSDYIDSL